MYDRYHKICKFRIRMYKQVIANSRTSFCSRSGGISDSREEHLLRPREVTPCSNPESF